MNSTTKTRLRQFIAGALGYTIVYFAFDIIWNLLIEHKRFSEFGGMSAMVAITAGILFQALMQLLIPRPKKNP